MLTQNCTALQSSSCIHRFSICFQFLFPVSDSSFFDSMHSRCTAVSKQMSAYWSILSGFRPVLLTSGKKLSHKDALGSKRRTDIPGDKVFCWISNVNIFMHFICANLDLCFFKLKIVRRCVGCCMDQPEEMCYLRVMKMSCACCGKRLAHLVSAVNYFLNFRFWEEFLIFH